MSRIRVEEIPEFKGDAVILMAMDINGIRDVLSAVKAALLRAGEESVLRAGEMNLIIKVDGGRTYFSFLGDGVVHARILRAKACEIVEKLNAMIAFVGPCHEYVEIDAPVGALVLSKDEYL